MTYFGLPPFYPAGWFWIGGRLAALTGTPAWEMFKPWAITSIAVAIVVAFVLWASMIRFEYALIVTTATAAATLAYSSAEPYAADHHRAAAAGVGAGVVGAARPAAGGRLGGRVGVGLFLGVAGAVLLTAARLRRVHRADHGGGTRRWHRPQPREPLLRLAVAGVIAAAIALIGWLPYLLAAVGGRPPTPAPRSTICRPTARSCPSRCCEFTLLGALCMVGTLWLVIRARSSTRAAGMRIGVVAVYAWSLLSMLTTLAGTTLLSFRLQPTLTVLLTAAGVFGFIEATLAVARRYSADTGRRLVVAAGAVGAIGAMTFAQDIPDVLRSDIVVAYTDTDGYGQRADRRPPGAEKYYREIDAKIRGDRQTAQRNRRADRRLQLPVLLPLLRLPGPDVALRQPACAVRRAGGDDRALGDPGAGPTSSSPNSTSCRGRRRRSSSCGAAARRFG